MADTDVKSLMLQVDASVELLRSNLLKGERASAAFRENVSRQMDNVDRRFASVGKSLTGLGPTIQQVNTQIATMGATTARVERQISASASTIRSALLSSTAGIASAFSANQVKDYADAYTRYTNQLKVAGLEGENLGRTQNGLFGIAQKYGVELEGIGSLYGRVSQGAKELGASQADLLRFTNGVGAALKIQGGTAASTSSALLQLSQLLGGTVVHAEEFNSINEGARPILQAVANGVARFGGSVAKLRAEVLEGKLSSQEFFQGFLSGSQQLEQQAQKANLTITASFTVLNNALGRYIGETDASLSATQRLSQGIVGIANNLNSIVPALTAVGVGFGVRLAAGPIREATLATSLLVRELTTENVVRLGGKVAAAQKAQAVSAAAQAEVAEIQATIAARRADTAALQANLVLIERQRAEALTAQAAMKANIAAGFGTVGVTRSAVDAARANQDLKAQIVTKRALAAANAEIAVSEAALAAAQTRSIAATTAATAATSAATVAARAGAAATRLFAGGLTLIGGSVAGGAAVLAIGAVIAAVMSYSNAVEEARQRDAEFVENGKTLNEHLRNTAQYGTSAASGVTQFGGGAAGAIPSVRGLSNAAGDLAANLQRVAEARKKAAIADIAADESKARADVAYYDKRFASTQQSGSSVARFGYLPDSDQQAKDRAYYSARYNEAQARLAAAQKERDRLQKLGLDEFTPTGDNNRSRDLSASDDLARLRRDLTVAQQSGNKAQIADLKAQQFELTQYQKYRKDGLSAASATSQAQKDAADFRKASGEKEANVATAKAARGAASEKRKEEAAVRDAASDARAYASAERQANNDIAAAHAELTGSAQERAQIERDRIEAERASRNEEIGTQGPKGLKRFTQAEVAILQAKNDQRAALETELVDLSERRRLAQEQLDASLASSSNERELLEAKADLATTARERRDLELRILDIQYQEEEARLRAVTVANGATEAEQALAEQRIAMLDQLKDLGRQSVERRNEGPLDQFKREAATAANDINGSIEQIQVNGFRTLIDDLADTGAEYVKLGGIVGDVVNGIIRDLIRLAAQQAIVGAIGGLGGLLGNSGGGGAGMVAGGALTKILGGSSAGIVAGDEWNPSSWENGAIKFLTGKRADGGPVSAGKAYLVGERGMEVFVPSVSGSVISNANLQRGRGGGGGTVRIEVAEGQLFEPRIAQISGDVSANIVQSAAPSIQQGAINETYRQLGRQRI